MLLETTTYLKQRLVKDKSFTHEIIIVDDGSTDCTSQTAIDYAITNTISSIKVFTLNKNIGKGGAVTQVTQKNIIKNNLIIKGYFSEYW